VDRVLYKPALHRVDKRGVTLLIDPERPNWVAVNSHGARVLDQCNGRRTAEEIVERLASSYSRDDVRRFIGEGLRCGLIGTEPFPAAHYPGRAAYLEPEALEELWVYVTNRCNLRCRHCLVSGGEGFREELSGEELKEVLRESASLGVKRFFFTGGEPFMRRDLLELIEYVTEELKLELVILSNGTLLDRRRVERLSRYPGVVMQVSLEGPSASINDAIRGGGAFVKALAGVELLRACGVRTIVTSTAMKENLAAIPELNSLLYDKDVRTHHILWVHKRGRASENLVSVGARELVELMRRLKDGGVMVDNWESYRARVYGGRGRKVDGCHGGLSSLSIDSNGDVYPCPSLTGEHKFRMGNVKSGLKKVWLTSKVGREFRRVTVAGIKGCRGCELRFFCGGGCRCQSYYASEEPSLYARDPYCEVIRYMLVESMLGFVNPDGEERPRILGYMRETSLSCGVGEADAPVVPFHCTCVLDAGAEKRALTEARYRMAAVNPEKDLCCPKGYSDADLEGLPEDTISLSYGCGNPTAFAELNPGETVLDIGAGGGIDCFIAAKKVGSSGRVIGVDMTDEMLKVANKNREKMAGVLGYDVVEFRKGLAEALPVEDCSIDLVISNCVINLSPDKKQVFREIYRVLKSGGRFSISDIVSDRPVPEEMRQDEELWSGCVSGALTKDDLLSAIREAGFKDILVEKMSKWKEVNGIGFHSITIRGWK